MFDRAHLARGLFLAFLLVVGLCHSAAPALGDGGFAPPADYTGKDLTEPSQRAVIVHDNGIQSLMLFVDYHGGARNFAWIVPCPAKPHVNVTDSAIFKEATKYHHHLAVEAWKYEMKHFPKDGAGGGGPSPEPKVTLHETKIIGDYKIAVLSAVEGDALTKWLNRNGYRVPKGLGPVIAQYVKEKWYFAAVKVRAEAGRRVTLKPLRLDFKADKPVYPLRISAANRGVTDVRVFLFERPAKLTRPKFNNRYSRAMWVGTKLDDRCPKLAAAFPKTRWEGMVLVRITKTFVPQVMCRLDDRLHAPPRGTNKPAERFFHPRPCSAHVLGIAEAMLSDNVDEANWAAENLNRYYYVKPRPGDLPKEDLAALAKLGKRLGLPLRDKLLSKVKGIMRKEAARRPDRRVPYLYGKDDVNVQGALILLTRTCDGEDEVVLKFIEAEAAKRGGRGTFWDSALRDLNSPASRRALARVAVAKKGVGAAFRFVYSLEDNAVTRQEQYLACREMVAILDGGAAVGDAKKRAFRLLKKYTGQDFGQDTKAWSAWLARNPKAFKG